MAAAKRTIPGLEDTKKQIAYDALARAERLRERCNRMRGDIATICEAVEPIHAGSVDDDLQYAAEAVAGAARRVALLAVECGYEAGRLVAEAAIRARLNDLS
jgi:hypothetical protein